MKKVLLSLLLCLAILTLMAGCGSEPQKDAGSSVNEAANEAEATQTDDAAKDKADTTIVNPVTELTEKEAADIYDHLFRIPENAKNVKWSKIDNAEGSITSKEALLELDFELDGKEFTARQQATGKVGEYASGMFYDWTVSEPFTFKDINGTELSGVYYRFISQSEYADLCTWYDASRGMSYSVSVTDKSLDGFDLQAIVEAITP